MQSNLNQRMWTFVLIKDRDKKKKARIILKEACEP